MPDKVVGVIGLGLMGTAISERLLDHGYRVNVWNRTREEAQPLISRGAVWTDNPVSSCQRLVISLYSSEVVSDVLSKMESGLRAGQFLVDTTTGAPEQTIEIEQRLASRGVNYLDAPISGSSEQTRRGEAMVMVGGARAAFDACSDLWPVLGKQVFHVGACGTAAKMKLVTNLVLGLNRAALAEGLAFSDILGVDAAAALEVLKGSAAYSRAMDVKGQKMIEEDFSVQARLAQHLKDVKLMLDAARRANVDLPMSTTHCQLLEQAVEAGLGELDNSAIVKVLRPDRL
ncbi:NAD(P)-dependent oxidoreductase [Planctomicrobium sp. SH664]|uniref:NAD(P)-dependent oxidoreductase n=1 Tax=Planctomicrobium sp. SH664 TaxID=3448125 RepID=UPI003F5C4C60